MSQQPKLQGRQIAHADPAGAMLDTLLHQLPVNAVEQARQSVASARGQGDARRRLGHTVDSGQACCVVPGEALIFKQGGFVELHVEAKLCQPLGRALERRGLGDSAGGGIDGQSAHVWGSSRCRTSPVGMGSSA